jgi:hypothetical protein
MGEVKNNAKIRSEGDEYDSGQHDESLLRLYDSQ